MNLDQLIPPPDDDEEMNYVNEKPPPYHIAVGTHEHRLQPSSPPPYTAAVPVAAAAAIDGPISLTAIDPTSIVSSATAEESINYRKQKTLAIVVLVLINPLFGLIALILASKSVMYRLYIKGYK